MGNEKRFLKPIMSVHDKQIIKLTSTRACCDSLDIGRG